MIPENMEVILWLAGSYWNLYHRLTQTPKYVGKFFRDKLMYFHVIVICKNTSSLENFPTS